MNPEPCSRAASPACRPRFRGQTGRLLLLRSGYFLEREIQSACSRLGWPLACLDLPPGPRLEPGFLTQLLEADTAFRPDFALTVNHLGLDQQGVLLQVFERLRLPLASWFVDSPRLILHEFSGQQSPWLALFTWDKDTLPQLSAQGFESVTHLPLATDSALFTPGRPAKPQWNARAAFVGDSMSTPVAKLEKKLAEIAGLLPQARSAAAGFVVSPHHLAATYLAETSPDLQALAPTPRARLDLEQYVTFEATRLSRLERVRALLPFQPLIAGDAAWKNPAAPFRLDPPSAPGLLRRPARILSRLQRQSQRHQPADERGRQPARLRRTRLRGVSAHRRTRPAGRTVRAWERGGCLHRPG